MEIECCLTAWANKGEKTLDLHPMACCLSLSVCLSVLPLTLLTLLLSLTHSLTRSCLDDNGASDGDQNCCATRKLPEAALSEADDVGGH